MYTQFCHDLTQFLGNKFHKVDHIFRFASETFAQFRVLRSNTHRTCIQITHTHHDAAHCHKGCCGKTKFLCTKDRCHCYITACHQLAVRFKTDS